MRALAAVLLIGCGRLSFDPSIDATVDPRNIDAPALPTRLICDDAIVPITGVAANADLAIAEKGGGFAVAWASPASGVFWFELDAQRVATQQRQINTGPVDQIGGLMATPITTVLVTARGAQQSLWTVPAEGIATRVRAETSLLGRDSLFTDLSTIGRAWARATPAGIVLAYVGDDGALGPDNMIPTVDTVVALSATSNEDHLHLTRVEDPGGGVTSCIQGDIDLGPLYPVDGGSSSVASSCSQLRIASGPPATDSILNIYRTPSGAIEMRYQGGTVNAQMTLAVAGRAPKIQFDGTWFWAAWIDEQPTGAGLRLAKIAQDLTFEAVDLPGWVTVGDEAFELVRRNTTVFLALLGTDTFSMLRTCP